MKILAFDTSGAVASVAILDDDRITAEYSINYNMTHSVTLMPMLESILTTLRIDLSGIDAIAVAAGPGSFTGLKIGCATVKALAYSLNKPIIPVKTTMALASNLYLRDGIVCPIMDARRDRVYAAIYEYRNYELRELLPQEVYRIEELTARLNQSMQPVMFLGDGVPVYRDSIAEHCSCEYAFAPAHMSLQRAGSVATAARLLYDQGMYESAEEHKPIYIRESSAVKLLG